MFLQARSGIDVGSVPRAPTLNCSFLIPQTTCGNGSANRDSQGRFLRKKGHGPDGHAPISFVRLQLLLERARRIRPNRKHVAAAGAGVR